MNLLKLFSFVFFYSISYGQNCTYKNLSKSFDLQVNVKRMKDDSCSISVQIFEKKTLKKIQTIKITSDYIFENDFRNCSSTRSYLTNVNVRQPVRDNNFGDIIVADFNFDGKDDVAIKRNSGGNGGPNYKYFLQSKGRFYENSFLTLEMEYFPSELSKRKKTLTTLVHANAYQRCKKVYMYNGKNWKLVSKSFVIY